MVEWQLRTKVGEIHALQRGVQAPAKDKLANATEITMEVPDRVGLIADVLECLNKNNVGVVHAHIYTTAEGLASNYPPWWDVATGEEDHRGGSRGSAQRARGEVLQDSKRDGPNKTRPASNSAAGA